MAHTDMIKLVLLVDVYHIPENDVVQKLGAVVKGEREREREREKKKDREEREM